MIKGCQYFIEYQEENVDTEKKKWGRRRKLTSRCVPRNVTVKQPHARVIRLECDCNITPSRYENNVSSWRINEVECLVAVDWVKGCILLGENDNVHAMPVKWVCN